MDRYVRYLDLFAGTQSFRKALEEKYDIKCKDGVPFWATYKHFTGIVVHIAQDINGLYILYVGVDIESPEMENTILDLSADNIIDQLDLLLYDYKPDFIWASPVCNKFSMATTGKGGNTYFVLEDGTVREREREEYKFVNHNGYNKKPEKWESFVNEAKLAMKLHTNLVKIINHFNVPFAIENPANAMTKYIYNKYKRNVVDYCAYGFEYKKPTAIYSNINMMLHRHSKDEKHRHIRFDRINKTTNWPSHWNKNISTYANRSSVPPRLINDILDQIIELDEIEGGFQYGETRKD